MKTVLRWAGRIAIGLVAVLALTAGATYAISGRRFERRFDVPPHDFVVHSTPATVAQGARLAAMRGCADCHGAGLVGTVMIDNPALGRLVAPNLTTAGRGRDLTDTDWDRAVRHGVRRDGTGLLLMPSAEFQTLSDEDLNAIVSYARTLSVPAATTLPTRLGPAARALYVAGQIPLLSAERVNQTATHARTVTATVTPQFGRYVAVTCSGCHGERFTGSLKSGPESPPGSRPAANLTPAGRVGRWSEAEFVHALRTARRPDGTTIDSTVMPIRMTAAMTDTELRAVYSYLRSLPALATGK